MIASHSQEFPMPFEGANNLEDEGKGGNQGEGEGTSRPNEDDEQVILRHVQSCNTYPILS